MAKTKNVIGLALANAQPYQKLRFKADLLESEKGLYRRFTDTWQYKADTDLVPVSIWTAASRHFGITYQPKHQVK